MKKYLLIAVFGLILTAIVWNATQTVISVAAGIGREIPQSLINGVGYENYLKDEIRQIDGYDLERLKKSWKEDLIWRQKYYGVYKRIAGKMAEIGQTQT